MFNKKFEKYYRPSNYEFSMVNNMFKIDKINKETINKEFDLKGIKFPVELNELTKLEEILDVSVNVFAITFEKDQK